MPRTSARDNEISVVGAGTRVPLAVSLLSSTAAHEGQASRPIVRIGHCPAVAFSDTLRVSPKERVRVRKRRVTTYTGETNDQTETSL